MRQPWGDDDAILAELRAALSEVPPVPAEFTATARASLTWRTVDAELLLAELAFDSSSQAALATRSGDDAARMLIFDGGGYRVEAQVSADGIAGQVTPVDGGMVSCQTAAGNFDEAAIDETGCFLLQCPSSGPVRLHVVAADHEIATSWINLS